MKTMKKLLVLMLSVSLLTLCTGIVSLAANGELIFSDPDTAVGEEVTVEVTMSTAGDAIGDGEVTVKYDTEYLRFISGENAEKGEEEGTIVLSSTGDGSVSELEYTMEFQALKEGETKIEVEDYTAYLHSDETLELELGNSTVTIAEGDPSKIEEENSKKVTIDGVEYTVNETFSDSAMPVGFVDCEVQLDGEMHRAMQHEASGRYVFYLIDADDKSDYYFYDTDTAVFTETELIYITESVYILLLNNDSATGLPEEFQATTSDINGKSFTAWQNTSLTDYFLVYALGSDGVESFYQYDSVQATYQRFTVPEVEVVEEAEPTAMEKIGDFVAKYLLIIAIVLLVVFVIFLIIIIVLGVKLRHRNDELVEAYGNSNSGYSNPSKKRRDEEYYEDEDEDEYYDDEEYEDEYEDEDEYYDDDEYEDEYEDEDEYYDDEEEQEDEYYDDEEEYEEVPVRRGSRREKKSVAKENDDDFSISFIDLD